MARGVSIDFLADVSSFLRGTSDVVDSLERVGDSLDQVALDSAEATASMEADFRTAFDKVQTDSKGVGTTIGTNVSKGTAEAGKATGEFRQEAKANLSEVVSSFDGSAKSIVDLTQGTFGGLVTALGPAGIVGAAAIAAGVGLASALFSKSKEEAKKAAQEFSDFAKEVRKAGGTLDQLDWTSKIEDFALEVDGTSLKVEELAKVAKQTGIELPGLVAGLAGKPEAAAAELDILNQRLADTIVLRDQLKQQGRGFDTVGDVGADLADAEDRVDALEKQRDEIAKVVKANEDQAEVQRLVNEAMEAAKTVTDKLAESTGRQERLMTSVAASEIAATDAIKAHNQALEDQANAFTGAFSAAGDYEAAIDAGNATVKENGETLDLSTEKGRANQDALLALAQASKDYADAKVAETGHQKDGNKVISDGRQAFIDLATSMGLSKQEAKDLATDVGLVHSKVDEKHELNVDTTKAETDINAMLNKDYKITIPIELDLDPIQLQTVTNKVTAQGWRFVGP